jgi:site-specific DNA recombinase
MIRVAVYARYSTDLQSDRSIEDQLALCQSYAERNKLTIVATYADRARSGSSTINRDGWQQLMRDAEARAFDVVLAEDVDRISRDEADYHPARKRLAFLGIKIHTVHGGELSQIEGSMRAMMGAMFLENLAHKTRRGLAGVVAQGRYPGGRIYGYRNVPGKPGQLEIFVDEASVVRRIFAEYAAGRTPRDIARDLTREGIPSPRGGRWAASTINGNKKRANGILQSEIYAGRIIWNRLRMDRDPDTGKRVSRPNPKSEWHKQDAPKLAIVDRQLFDAVRERKATRSIGHPTSHRRPRHILSGLLRCGACGGGMSVSGKDKSGRQRIYCTADRESGTCPNPRTFYLPVVENAVLDSLRSELRHPTVMAEYAKAYIEERNRLAHKLTKDRSRLERRLAATRRELERAAKLLIKGVLPEETGAKQIAALEAERVMLTAKLEPSPVEKNAVALHPAALARYESQLAKLQQVLAAGTSMGDTEAAAAIRDLVETVTVRPHPDRRGGVLVEIAGRLNALLGDESHGVSVCSKSVGKLVAGAGIEPATYGL